MLTEQALIAQAPERLTRTVGPESGTDTDLSPGGFDLQPDDTGHSQNRTSEMSTPDHTCAYGGRCWPPYSNRR